MSIADNLRHIKTELGSGVALIAVSKYSADNAVEEAYRAGHRDFGENKAQDLKERYDRMPKDIKWHFIGHLQRNKVKYVAPFIHLIHSVDSVRLLEEIDKQAAKNSRIIPCLLQVHIAKEETKFGFSENEIDALIEAAHLENLVHVQVVGLMGMATNTNNIEQIRTEFSGLKAIFERLKTHKIPGNVSMEVLSMGMSADYKIALQNGTTMVRIGSSIFR